MERKHVTEFGSVAQFALIITILLFSVVLTVLNFFFGWEHWPIPLIVACALGCTAAYVSGRIPQHMAIYLYAAILIIEVFYYTVNSDRTYDSTAVIILLLMILATTREAALPWIGYGVSMCGVAYSLIFRERPPGLGISYVIRTEWHLLLCLVAIIVVERLLSVLNRYDAEHHRRIAVLEQENQAASDFLTNVSHELRTPVNAVIGLTGLSIEEEENDVRRGRLTAIYEAANRVAEQVGDIMDFSEIDMGRLALNEEDYMLSSLLTDLVTALSPRMKKNVEVVFDVDAAAPSVLRGDAAKLKKILWHLIDNAVKFTKEGGVFVRITCEEQDYGVNLNMEVTDTGIGMDMAEEQRSFRRFYQADSVRTRSSGGLGLGLPIVIGFLKVMGGFLYVDSTPGSGSTLRVSIPQKVVDASECIRAERREEVCIGTFFVFQTIEHPQVREFYGRMIRHFVNGIRVTTHRTQNIENLKRLVENVRFTHIFTGAWEYSQYTDYLEGLAAEMVVCVVAEAGVKPVPGAKVRFIYKPIYAFPLVNILNHGTAADEDKGELYLPGIRALVVDDEPMNLTVAIGIFDKYGMEVTTAASGQEAIALCETSDFDIVFMDHMMPGMDGVEAMKRIRAEAKRRGTEYPFVALTANALSSAREMFFAEGFEGFVSKPIELTELERVLKKLLPKAAIKYRTKKEEPGQGTSEADERHADLLSGLASLGIDTAMGMHYSRNDIDFYALLLGQFSDEASEKEQNAKSLLDKGNLGEYAVIVHSVKGTARMIGAAALSEQALGLEKAAKAGDETAVRAGNDGLFGDYLAMAGGIASILENNGRIDDVIVESTDTPQGGKMFEFLPKGGLKS